MQFEDNPAMNIFTITLTDIVSEPLYFFLKFEKKILNTPANILKGTLRTLVGKKGHTDILGAPPSDM